MKTLCRKAWLEDDGVLSFEWVLIITLLVIGIVGGVAATRDAVISELSDVGGAALCIDQGYTVEPVLDDDGNVISNGFSFSDSVPTFSTSRATGPRGQTE